MNESFPCLFPSGARRAARAMVAAALV
ncbi:lipopolysaccharide transport periplasmic protein LptA, partial [Burkholderia pseudomallei]